MFLSASISSSYATDLDVMIAASFAAKFEYCGNQLKDADVGPGWKIKVAVARERGKEIGSEHVKKNGYIKQVIKEKTKIRRDWDLNRCKRFLDDSL